MDSNNMYQNQQPGQEPDNNNYMYQNQQPGQNYDNSQNGNPNDNQGGYYQNTYTQMDNGLNTYTQMDNGLNTYTQGTNNQNTYTNPTPNPNVNPGYQYNPQNNGYQPVYQPMQADLEDPVTMGEWAITKLILMVPCLNVIMSFVWAFSSSEKKSKSNYFKVALIFGAIYTVLYILFIIWIINSASSGYNDYMRYNF